MNAALLASARATFGRLTAYRVANWAGLFTNGLFLVFRAALLEACFEASADPAARIGGMRVVEATGYAVMTQAILMVAPQWGSVGIAANVRTGQIAVELIRPVDFVWMHFAGRLGASAYYALFRMLPLVALGFALGWLPLPTPTALALFAATLVLGSIVANAILFLVEVSSFWIESERGVRYVVLGLAVLPSGLTLPLSWFPDPIAQIFMATPYTLHLPVEAWLGRVTPAEAAFPLFVQAAYAIGLVLLCRWVFAAGMRKLTIQGG